MLLWVGLGNPGSEHARQRHNIGFMALDEIARRHRFPPWKKQFKGETTAGAIGTARVLLLKPMTYMNLSGDAVQAAAAFHKIPPAEITAWHACHFTNGPTEAMNNLIKRVKRVAFGFTSFRNYRVRALLYAGKPDWSLLKTIAPH